MLIQFLFFQIRPVNVFKDVIWVSRYMYARLYLDYDNNKFVIIIMIIVIILHFM